MTSNLAKGFEEERILSLSKEDSPLSRFLKARLRARQVGKTGLRPLKR